MNLRLISTKIHGVMDYVMGAGLIVLPTLLKGTKSVAAKIVPAVLGGSALIYSLFTDYEYSVKGLIPMKAHLSIDVMSGLFLASSPWIFGFKKRLFLPHLVLGITEILAGLMTQTTPSGHREMITGFFKNNSLFSKKTINSSVNKRRIPVQAV